MGGFYSQSCWRDDLPLEHDADTLHITKSALHELFEDLPKKKKRNRKRVQDYESDESNISLSEDLEEAFLYYRFYAFVHRHQTDEMDVDKCSIWLHMVNPEFDEDQRKAAINRVMKTFGEGKGKDRVLKVGGFVKYYNAMKRANEHRYDVEMRRLGINDDIYHYKGKYIADLSSPIGSGAFGFVFWGMSTKAATCGPYKQVAIKDIRFKWNNRNMLKRNIRELRILRKVSKHKSIIHFYDLKLPDGKTKHNFNSAHMIMGYMKSDLEQHLRNQSISYTELQVRVLMKQLVQGVRYLHDWHLVHRDLKPANILVNMLPNGKIDCKICDFGLSRSFDENADEPKVYFQEQEESVASPRSRLQMKNVLSKHVATRYWRAPEISLLAQERINVTGIDIWALGCIFAQVLQMVEGIGCWKLGNIVNGRGDAITEFKESHGIIQVHIKQPHDASGGKWVPRKHITPDPERQRLFNGSFDCMLSGSRIDEGSEDDQLICICQYLGKPPKKLWDRFRPGLKEVYKKYKMDHPKVTFRHSLNASADAISLLEKMLTWDPNERIKAEAALYSDYFKELEYLREDWIDGDDGEALDLPTNDRKFAKSMNEFEDVVIPASKFKKLILDEILYHNEHLRDDKFKPRESLSENF